MKRHFAIILALLTGLYILGGCSKKITGPSRTNIPPTVEFVNVPVEGAKFSSDTTIYWYGTDVDGFIKYFKYAVIESTTVGPDPIAYITNTPEDSISWITLTVKLDNPNTKQKIKMSADVRDPVRKYISSYVFIYAVDNLDAKSWPPRYRMFRKNNHFPDTRISTNQLYVPYVNAKSSSGGLGGINVNFVGSDRIDYPRNPPPFDFYWKLYGPYDSLEMVTVTKNYLDSIFVDIYGDFYYKGDTIETVNRIDTTIDTTVIPPDTIFNTIYNKILVDTLKTGNSYGVWSVYFYDDSLPSDLSRLVEESYNPLTGDHWVSDTKVDIYDVFRNQHLPPSADTTRLQYFIVRCQARDDSRVEDPVPAYAWVAAIEPKFEREAIVIDATNYGLIDGGNFNWPKMPGIYWGREGQSFTPADWPTTVKNVYGRMVNNWKPGSFDTANILPPDTVCTGVNCETYIVIEYAKYKCTQDYFAVAPLLSAPDQGIGSVSLRDILKHKMVILIKDTPYGPIDFDRSLEGQYIRKGIYAGMSAWSMVRNPFGLSFTDINGLRSVPATYALTFGVQLMNVTAWEGFDTHDYNRLGWNIFGPSGQIRIEDFKGAKSLVGSELPDIYVDTTLLENRYIWLPGFEIFNFPYRWPSDGSIITGAYPEVGYVSKLFGAEAIYSYSAMDSLRPPSPPFAYAHSSAGTDSLRTGIIAQYDGTVVAVRYQTPLYRTAHFSFGLLPLDSVQAQQAFNGMMDWLSVQPYLTTGIPSSAGRASFDLARLKKIDREMDDMANQKLLGPMVPNKY